MRHRPRNGNGDRRDKKRSKNILMTDKHVRDEESAEMTEAVDLNDPPRERVVEIEEWQIGATLPNLAGQVGDIVESTFTGPPE